MWRWYIVDRTQASGYILQNIWLEHGKSDNILLQRRHDHSCEPNDLLSVINCSHVRTGKGQIYCWLSHLKNLKFAKKTQFQQVLQSFPLLLAPVLPCPLLFTAQRSWHLFSHSPLLPAHILNCICFWHQLTTLSCSCTCFNRPWKTLHCRTAWATSWRAHKNLHSSTLKILCCPPLIGCPQHLWAHISESYLFVNLCCLAVMKNHRKYKFNYVYNINILYLGHFKPALI